MHLMARVKIDSIILLDIFGGREGGKKRKFFGLRLHRPRVISSRQTMVSVAAIGG